MSRLKYLLYIYFLSNNFLTLVALHEGDNKGNWYEKLHWWNQARPTYQEVHKQVQSVREAANSIDRQKTEMLAFIDNFFKQLRINSTTIINSITAELADKHNSDQALTTLEELKKDIEAIFLARKQIEQAAQLAQQQIKQARTFEKNAQAYFDELEYTLDDKKARILYEKIENSNENLQALDEYISVSLRNFIFQTARIVDQTGTNIKKHLELLKKEHVQLQELTPEEKAAQEKIKKETLERQKKLKEQSEQTWWEWFKSLFK